MDLGLAGKVVLVTGGSSNIGRATAARLLAEGARVATCARHADRLETVAAELRARHGDALLALPADVSTATGVQRFVDGALARFGTLHGLVNNAGSSEARAFLDVSDADWQADIDIKLMAAIRAVRLCLPHPDRLPAVRARGVHQRHGRQPRRRRLSCPLTYGRIPAPP